MCAQPVPKDAKEGAAVAPSQAHEVSNRVQIVFGDCNPTGAGDPALGKFGWGHTGYGDRD